MRTEQTRSKQSSESNRILVAGAFYTFVLLTGCALLFHLFGTDWFSSTVRISEPSLFWQKAIKALLKIFELVFVYKILGKRGYAASIIVSIIHTIGVGFLPVPLFPVANAACMLIFSFLLRPKFRTVINFAFLYALMSFYGAAVLIAKFGTVGDQAGISFYANIAAALDYKLFLVTIYFYIKYKGGFKLWKSAKIVFLA